MEQFAIKPLADTHDLQDSALLPEGIDHAEGAPGKIIQADVSLFHQRPNYTLEADKAVETGSDPKLSAPTYEDGFEAGRLQAEQVFTDTIKVMESTLAAFSDDLRRFKGDLETSHMQAIQHCLHAVLPHLVETSYLAQIEAILKDRTHILLGETCCLSVHPDVMDKVEAHITAQFPDLIIETRPEMSRHAAELNWMSGGQVLDMDAALAACLKVIGSHDPVSGHDNDITV